MDERRRPAFPVPDYSGGPYSQYTGMTLRDYFAAKVMQGEIASQNEYTGFWQDHSKLAEHAYKVADQMMKARG